MTVTELDCGLEYTERVSDRDRMAECVIEWRLILLIIVSFGLEI